MQNKIVLKLWGIWDIISAILFRWLLLVLIFVFACVILHNILKMTEISSSYSGPYKKMVEIYNDEDKFMSCYMTR